MTYASRFIFARALGNIYFWGSISIPYLVYRGFSIASAFSLLSFYSLLVVILEFPTGVIGDLFGHKLTVILANLLGAITMLLLALKLPVYGYYLVFVIAALSAALVSGSDEAYLKSLSTDFRSDLSKVRKYGNIFIVITTGSAGFLAKYGYWLPLSLTALAWVIGSILIFPLPDTHSYVAKKGNIFKSAFSSIKYVFASIPLMAVMLYGSLNEGYQFSVKTVINSATPSLNIDLWLVSIIVGLGFLSRVLALQFAKNLEKVRTKHLFVFTCFLFSILTIIKPSIYSIILIALTNFTVSLVNLRTDLAIHDLVSDSIRASVLSFKNLFVRLFSSSYLFIAGFLIDLHMLQLLMFITLTGYAITGLASQKLAKHAKK